MQQRRRASNPCASGIVVGGIAMRQDEVKLSDLLKRRPEFIEFLRLAGRNADAVLVSCPLHRLADLMSALGALKQAADGKKIVLDLSDCAQVVKQHKPSSKRTTHIYL